VFRLSTRGDSINGSYRLIGQSGTIFMILFSEDGRRIITISADLTAYVWTAEEPVFPNDFNDLLALAKNALPVTLTREELRQLTQ